MPLSAFSGRSFNINDVVVANIALAPTPGNNPTAALLTFSDPNGSGPTWPCNINVNWDTGAILSGSLREASHPNGIGLGASGQYYDKIAGNFLTTDPQNPHRIWSAQNKIETVNNNKDVPRTDLSWSADAGGGR